MKVWHYTPYRNWEMIQRHGLLTSTAKINGTVIEPATWVWLNKPGTWLNFGHVISRMIRHHTMLVACLEVRIRKRELWSDGQIDAVLGYSTIPNTMVHTCTMGPHGDEDFPEWELHKGEPFRLLRKVIPPDRITLLGVYGISDHGTAPEMPAL